MTQKSVASYAERYIKNFGFHVVPIEPGRKFPRSNSWGKNAIDCPAKASEFFIKNSDWNLGIALGPSGLCSLDIDDLDSFKIICEVFGVDLDELVSSTPTIVGRQDGMRLEFRVPDGMELPYVKLNWRPESDPTGEKYKNLQALAREAKKDGNEELAAQYSEEAKQYAVYTVFELRSATDGSQKQDVFPPSIHPETGEPYRWISQPRKDWPEPPAWLLTIWKQFDKIKPQLLAACPWSIQEEIYKPRTVASKPRFNGESGGYSRVVQEYNRATSIENELSSFGYKPIGKRFLAPTSSTGLPGVVLFDDNRAWIHHASDPLCSDESGQPVSPFDLRCYYEFRGDFKSAVQAIASELGIRLDAPRRQEIDPETGEVLTGSPTRGEPSTEVAFRDTLPAQFVDYESPLPWTDSKNKPLKHHENLVEIIRRLGVTVRYNVIKKEEEIIVPQQGFSLDNHSNAAVAWLMSQCSLFNFTTDSLQDFLTLIADSNQYNPVLTWIESKPWDGVSRLGDFYATIKTSGCDELKQILMKRWMLSAIAAADTAVGISARGVLVFQGEQQMGKTAWFKRLVPDHLDVIQDGVILRPDDKDSVKHAVSNWLVELGELDATFKKSDIAQLKGFITRDRDHVRMPYARKESSYPRRTVFFGSVNPREFLNDPTGNTRFWTIPCTAIDYKHTLDMQQVWAEFYALYKAGETHNLTVEETEILNGSNDDYMAIDPVEELLLKGLDWDSPTSTWRWAMATEALLDAGIDRPNKADAMRAATLIRSKNGGEYKRTKHGRMLLTPPKKTTYFGG